MCYQRSVLEKKNTMQEHVQWKVRGMVQKEKHTVDRESSGQPLCTEQERETGGGFCGMKVLMTSSNVSTNLHAALIISCLMFKRLNCYSLKNSVAFQIGP